MGAQRSIEYNHHQIMRNSHLMRDMVREAQLVENARLARTSRFSRRLLQDQRRPRAQRMIDATIRATRPPWTPLHRALRTPGAGYASRQLARGTPEASEARVWAEGGRARALAAEPGQISVDLLTVLDDPSRVRSLLELGPDTDWLQGLMFDLAERGSLEAVSMLVLDMPRRAPRGGWADEVVDVAIRESHFEMALMLLDNGYQFDQQYNALDELADALTHRGQLLDDLQVGAMPELLRRVLDSAPLPAALGRSRQAALRRIGIAMSELPPTQVAEALRAHPLALWYVAGGAAFAAVRQSRMMGEGEHAAADAERAWREACEPLTEAHGPLWLASAAGLDAADDDDQDEDDDEGVFF